MPIPELSRGTMIVGASKASVSIVRNIQNPKAFDITVMVNGITILTLQETQEIDVTPIQGYLS